MEENTHITTGAEPITQWAPDVEEYVIIVFFPWLQQAALGGFILFFGFLAFNGGSQAAIASAGDADTVALAIVNTIIGGELSSQ